MRDALPGGQLAVGHQQEPLILALRQRILGAEHQRFGDRFGIVTGSQLDDRDVLGLPANGADRLAGVEVLALRCIDQQVPGLRQGFGQVVAGRQSMHPGRLSGIAEKADQTLSLVLRVFENQQADGFFAGHGNS